MITSFIRSMPLTGTELLSVGATVANAFNRFDTPIKCLIGAVAVASAYCFSGITSSAGDKIFGVRTLVYEGGEGQMEKATNAVVELKDKTTIPFETNGEISIDLRNLNVQSITLS